MPCPYEMRHTSVCLYCWVVYCPFALVVILGSVFVFWKWSCPFLSSSQKYSCFVLSFLRYLLIL